MYICLQTILKHCNVFRIIKMSPLTDTVSHGKKTFSRAGTDFLNTFSNEFLKLTCSPQQLQMSLTVDISYDRSIIYYQNCFKRGNGNCGVKTYGFVNTFNKLHLWLINSFGPFSG